MVKYHHDRPFFVIVLSVDILSVIHFLGIPFTNRVIFPINRYKEKNGIKERVIL